MLLIKIGVIVSLALLILAFRIDWRRDVTVTTFQPDQELVEMDEIRQTQQIEQPPPPPRPPVPIEVPNGTVLDDVSLDLDASLDLELATTDTTPPPPAPNEPEEGCSASALHAGQAAGKGGSRQDVAADYVQGGVTRLLQQIQIVCRREGGLVGRRFVLAVSVSESHS